MRTRACGRFFVVWGIPFSASGKRARFRMSKLDQPHRRMTTYRCKIRVLLIAINSREYETRAMVLREK